MNRYLLAIGAIFCAASAHADPVHFEDTSDKLGFERGTESWGIAWGNLNGDKYPDLWNSGHRDFTRLYRNTGTGDFEDVAAEYDAQMNDWWMILTQRDVHGGAWGDFDKDGDDDLIVGDEDEFFVNHADSGGYFERSSMTTRQAFAAWIPSSDGSTLVSETRCNGNYVQFIDVDNDGDLDKICGDADIFPESRSDAATDIIPEIGNVSDTIVGDFNNDLLQDIVAVRGALHSVGASKVDDTSIDAWFREGAGPQFTFAAVGPVKFIIDGLGGGAYLEADVLNLDTDGMTSGAARGIEINYDSGSGRWRVLDNSNEDRKDQHYVRVRATNSVSEPEFTGQDNRDLPAAMAHAVNNGNGFDWVYNTGLSAPVQCNSITTADFDNDMDLDLYLACGIGVDNTANVYYDNQGDGTFQAVTLHGGEGPVGSGYDFGVAESVIAADYDVDGFVDLAVVNGILFYPFGFGGPDTLIRNLGNDNHWVELDLIGVTSNGNGMGAKVYVTAGGVTQLREQNGGYHRWSQDHQRIHVGLADNAVIDEIRIEWPSGATDVHTNVAANVLYDAIEETSLLPADLGLPVVTAIEPGDECGIPSYKITYGPMIQVWRDCGTDSWHLRMRSGLGRMTENVPLISNGALVADTKFPTAKGINLGSPDSMSNESGVLSFLISVQDDSGPSKTINFSTSGQSRTCLRFNDRDIESVVIGASGKRLEPPFDLSNGFGPCDSDGDGILDTDDSDDDNDGVDDELDAFPFNPLETLDSDGDGVGDNADLFPYDANEWKDSDGDGLGDNTDVDWDNDGLTDLGEMPDQTPVLLTSPVFNIPAAGGESTSLFDLSELPVNIGDTVTLMAVVADGDLDSSGEYFSLVINSGEFASGDVRTDEECVDNLVPITSSVQSVVTVVDIGGGIPGLSVVGKTTADVGDFCAVGGVDYQLSVSIPPRTSLDQDGDGVLNIHDLDSDNDAIADVVEIGLVDGDNNFIVDDLLGQQGTVSVARDTDGDGIPDYLDLESTNPSNDGTAYDIDASGHAGLDTFRDGFLSDLDIDGGTDLDSDGIDDLIDLDNTVPGSTFTNQKPVALAANVVTTVNVAIAITLQGSDPDMDNLDFFVTEIPENGVLSGTAPNLTYTPDPDFAGPDSFTFVVNDGYGDSDAATVSVTVNDSDTPLLDWIAATGGVTTSANHVVNSGAVGGWFNNTVQSVSLSSLGFNDNFELRLLLESDPAGTTWVTGLGVDESSSSWTDVDFALRSSNGRLTVYENGAWRTNGDMLAQGDTISIRVASGSIEYRHNGAVVFSSTYVGAPEFYVDSSFKTGAVEYSVLLAGTPDPVTPPVEMAIINWSGEAGGVSTLDDQVVYSGAPSGWLNSANSERLSTLGAIDDYQLVWTIKTDPADTLWIAGLGITESSLSWNDVDYGMRSSNGRLAIYESGAWRRNGPVLAQGDQLSIHVQGTQLNYLHNGALVHSSSIIGGEDFYIDMSFKSGAVSLANFKIVQ